MKKKTRMRKRRVGSSAALAAALALPFLFAGQREQTASPRAFVAGTVFRDPGFAFPGARVVLISIPEPGSGGKPKKRKEVSDNRGEFLFPVPAVESHFKVSVLAKGFGPQEKTVEIRGEERVDVTFLLEPESK